MQRFLLGLFSLILAMALTACGTPPAGAAARLDPTATAPAPATPTAPPPSATAVAAATLTATPLPLPTQPSEPIGPDYCPERAGTVTALKIPSTTLRYAIDTRVYLPPCFGLDDRRYPVLYLLHGLGFTEDQWERLGVPAAADELIAAGAIAPLIIVMPRDRRDARLDPALVKDLLPYIDAAYPTLASRPARAIGGLSRGGGWAAHFGLRYPELFGRIGLHSPAVFYDDEVNLLEWARLLKDKPKPVVYIDSGENDATLRSPVWLDQVLTWFKIEHTFLIQPGSHTEAYWAKHVPDYLTFYAADWRALPLEAPAPDFAPAP